MADHSVTTEAGALELQVNRIVGQMRVSMPGNITSFDPGTQRVSVLPGIKLKVTGKDGVQYIDLPEIPNIPIVVPYAQGAGLLLTLPISEGDPCLLIFADRAIDNFIQSGSTNIPGTGRNDETVAPRAHHLSDAICIPGLISDVDVVPSWKTDAIELRDKERKHFISLTTNGITISDSVATWNMKEGKVTLDAPKGIENTSDSSISSTSKSTIIEKAPKITQFGNLSTFGETGGPGVMNITGDIVQTGKHTSTGDQVAGGISQKSHVHTGVTPGSENTGGPR